MEFDTSTFNMIWRSDIIDFDISMSYNNAI